MSDLARRADQPPTPIPAAAATLSSTAAASLVEWAQAAAAAYQLAQSLTKTGFVPERYRGKPDEATAAILAGAELGLSPMAAVRAFDSIQGTTAPKALTLVAVAQAHGHHVDVIEEDDEHATVRYRRRGEREWRTVTYTVADAQRAGLVGRNPNWRSQPRNMCVARAQAIAARRVAADALLAVPYSSEELADAAPDAPAAPTRVTVDELTGPDPEPEQRPEPVGDQRPATRAQVQRVVLMLRDLDVEDDDAQRAWLSQELHRPVESRSTLTRGEASTVIDVLGSLIAARDAETPPAGGGDEVP